MSRQDKIGLGVITLLLVLLLAYMVLYHVSEIPEREWRDFHKLSGKDIMLIAVNNFFYTEYEKGAKNRKKLDCSGMHEKIARMYGAKFKIMNAWDHGQELQKYGYRRRKLEDVRERDVIVFNKINGNGHLGYVVKVDTKEGKIYYIEQTRKTNGFNYNWVRYVRSNRVFGIFYVTPSYFYGERL